MSLVTILALETIEAFWNEKSWSGGGRDSCCGGVVQWNAMIAIVMILGWIHKQFCSEVLRASIYNGPHCRILFRQRPFACVCIRSHYVLRMRLPIWRMHKVT